MRTPLFLGMALALSACGTPQQQCVATATKNLRVVNRLIAESETNIARGYAIGREPVVSTGFDLCIGDNDTVVLCTRDEIDVIARPVAIDLRAERAKLASLKEKRDELNSTAAAQIRRCKALYPEA